MAYDKIEKVFGSTIQHGNLSKRAYLMKLADGDYSKVISFLDNLCQENKYTKIFAKIPESAIDLFKLSGYEQEAMIPWFFNGQNKAVFLAKYFSKNRSFDPRQREIEEVLKGSISNSKNKVFSERDSDISVEVARPCDVGQISAVYEKIFKSYPFPIHNPRYLLDTMQTHIRYYLIRRKGEIAALSSAEIDREAKAVEMTDFATLPVHRGHGLGSRLLENMEYEMAKEGIITSYTIARAFSYGINTIFAKRNYIYSGTLINNTNIAGNIESMNVWYKRINMK